MVLEQNREPLFVKDIVAKLTMPISRQTVASYLLDLQEAKEVARIGRKWYLCVPNYWVLKEKEKLIREANANMPQVIDALISFGREQDIAHLQRLGYHEAANELWKLLPEYDRREILERGRIVQQQALQTAKKEKS